MRASLKPYAPDAGLRPRRGPLAALRIAVAAVLLGGLAVLPAMAAGASFAERLEEARSLLVEGRHQEAEQQAEALLSEAEESIGRGSLAVADALDLLVLSRYLNGKRREERTLDLAQRAVALRRALQGPEDPAYATSLQQLADVLHSNLRFEEALALFEESMAIRTRVFGSDSPEVADSLDNLGDLYDDMGEAPRAKAALERALDIRERRLGPRHRDVGQSLNTLANVVYRMGSYEEAKDLWERALEIYETELPPDHPLLARALHNLGAVHHVLGDVDAAFTFYERALEIRKKVFGEIHPLTGGTHTALAMLLQDSGDFAGAREHYELALQGIGKGLLTDHPRYATVLSNLGDLQQASGDYEAARLYFEKALETRLQALGSRHPAYARSLSALGSLLADMGETDAARETLEQAINILEEVEGPQHPTLVSPLEGLAQVEEAAGNFTAARSYLERAVKLRESLDPEHPQLAKLLGRLARLLTAAGEPQAALPLFDRGLAVLADSYGTGHPQAARLYAGRARALFAVGRDEEAFEAGLQAAEIAHDHVLLTVRSLAERPALAYAGSMQESLGLVLSLLGSGRLEDPRAPEKAWNALIRSRALVLDEVSARHRIATASRDPEMRVRVRDWLEARQRLANLMVRNESQLPLARQAALLRDAQTAAVSAEQAMAERSRPLRHGLERRSLGYREVTASLPPRSALVAFSLYGRIDGSGKANPVYLAFVLLPGATKPRIVPLGPAASVDAEVQEVREAIRPGAGGSAAAEASYRSAASRLRQRVWDPVKPYLAGAEILFVVPDGSLNLVNFAALPAETNGYLIEEGIRFHLLTAEKDLVRSRSEEPPGKGLLAVGGVDFEDRSQFAALRQGDPEPEPLLDRLLLSFSNLVASSGLRDGCGAMRSRLFPPLQATRGEISELEAIWSHAPGFAEEPVLELSRDAATEAEIKRQAPGRRILHLATHGFFLGGRCEAEAGSTRGLASPAEARKALALSGLALAGANHRHEAWVGEQDAILTAEEIASLDLTGVEWAVLSACDTGIGEIRAGEGVFGLRRAFETAGVRTVIMSLWPVEDQSAREWMRVLYEGRLASRLPTYEAVHRASSAVLQARRRAGLSTHPIFWASFVAAGDWR